MYGLVVSGEIVEFPYSIEKFRTDNPLISLPLQPTVLQLEEQGIVSVLDDTSALVESTKKLGDHRFELQGSTWFRVFSVIDKTEEELHADQVLLREAIMTERDRRINGGITHNGIRFQTRPEDRENIIGSFALATAYLMTGGNPTSYTWHDPADGVSQFAFISENNTEIPMTAPMVMSFGKDVAKMKSILIFEAKALKVSLPLDYTNDDHWSSFN